MGDQLKHKLMVVDDNPQNCELIKQFFEKNYDIEIAYGGEEAISKIYNFNPAVILLDIMMPRLTGDELVKMIKVWKPEIHVIMVSANISPEVKKECMLHGAFACITKPIDFQHLKETIENALKQ
ncbi:MAG: response regulator [Nitrospinae bacterium]|nr:response regulator [Nitrospinota bacterium]MBL7021372.1 response regulator [Nitrospinaceae bacterium]